jgi:hypothetical protein
MKGAREMPTDRQNETRSGPMLAACKLYPRTSGAGRPYLVGRLGGLRLLVLPKREGEGGEHTHMLMLAEAPQQEGER